MNTASKIIRLSLAAGLFFALPVFAPKAQAAQSPPGCSANNLNVNIGVNANNITNGTVVTWVVTVQNPANPTSCDVTLGSEGLYFLCPGPNGDPNGTRTTLIPGGTTLPPGFGPQVFEIPCTVQVAAGVRTAEGKVSAPGSVVHKNPLQDDPANVDKTISVNIWQPCLRLTSSCVSAINSSGTSVAVTYSGTLSNCGNVFLEGVTVYSDQPAPNTLVLGPITLAAGAVTNFTATYTSSQVCGPFTTQLSAAGIAPLDTPVAVASTASSQCSISYNPAVAVTVNCPAQPVEPGGFLTISGVVSNAGNIALTNVVVLNNQPVANTVLLGPTTLAVGQSLPYSGNYTVGAEACPPYVDTVRAQGFSVCGNQEVNASATASCAGLVTPGIAISQNCPEVPASLGGPLTFTATVVNTGNVTLRDIVVVNDRPNQNTTVLRVASLPRGASTNFTGTFTVPGNLNACTIVNTLRVTSTSQCGGGAVTNSVTTVCNVMSAPAIRVTKACPGTVVAGGAPLTFTGTVSNAGNVTLTNVAVRVNRPVENTTILVTNSLAPGAWARFTGTYTAPQDECSVTDTVIAVGTDLCGNLVEHSTTTTCPLAVTRGLALARGCPEIATIPGQPLTFNGWITNLGNVTLTNVTIVVDRPAANTLFFGPVELRPGQAAGFFGSFVVPTNVNGCSISYNLSARGQDKCAGTEVTASTSGSCPIITTPRIVVAKSCPPNPVAQGSTLTFNGQVINAGDVALTNVVVVNDMPGPNTVVFRAALLQPGQTTNFTGSYTVPGDCCTVTATLQARGSDTCTGQSVTNTSTTICPVQFTPQIVVTKVCSTVPVRIGEVLMYSGTVSNSGNVTLTDVRVHNSVTGSANPVLGVSALAPGEIMPWTASYTVPQDFCGADVVTVRGFSLCGETEVTHSVSSACPVLSSPSLIVTRTCPSTVLHCTSNIFTATIINTGDVTLTNVQVFSGTPAVNAPLPGFYNLAPGQGTNVTFTIGASEDCDCCELVNTVLARGNDRCSGRTVTASSTVVCKYQNQPRIGVTLNCPSDGETVSGVVHYGGTVINLGDITLTNVTVWSSHPGANTRIFGPVTLARGEARTFETSYTASPDTLPAGAISLTVHGTDPCSGAFATAQDGCNGSAIGLPVLVATLVDGNMLSLSWSANPGVTYRLQHSSTLAAESWQDEAGDITAQSTVATRTVQIGTAPWRFYRVMIVR